MGQFLINIKVLIQSIRFIGGLKMSKRFEVGKKYKVKSYLDCGFNFRDGKYKIKAEIEGFPQKPINNKNELKIAKEHWLEGFEEDEKEYQKLYDGIWYYLEFPEGDKHEWIPVSILKDAFETK